MGPQIAINIKWNNFRMNSSDETAVAADEYIMNNMFMRDINFENELSINAKPYL